MNQCDDSMQLVSSLKKYSKPNNPMVLAVVKVVWEIVVEIVAETKNHYFNGKQALR